MYPQYRDWEVVRLIGEGTYGSVYEIRREVFGHISRAALKVISIPNSKSEIDTARSNGMDDASISEYYQSVAKDIIKEVQVMDRLKGITNIVSYEDFEYRQHEDGYGWDIFIQMELLTSLTHHINMPGTVITRRDVIRLGIDICRALEECQKESIVHRDIKPANILISDRGHYKLGDFGIARTVEGINSVMSMSKKGTYSYMAPEVYKAQRYGFNVDIYSLGLVMYFLLNNNRNPFFPPFPERIKVGDAERAMAFRMSGEPLPQPCSDATRLAEIVLKACSYSPKDRYSSPREMRNDLESILPDISNAGPVLWPITEDSSSAVPSQPASDVSADEQETASIGVMDYQEESVQSTHEQSKGEQETQQEQTKKSFDSADQESDKAPFRDTSAQNDSDKTTDLFDFPSWEPSSASEEVSSTPDKTHLMEDEQTSRLLPLKQPPKPEQKTVPEHEVQSVSANKQETPAAQKKDGSHALMEPVRQPIQKQESQKKNKLLQVTVSICLIFGIIAGLIAYRNTKMVVVPDVSGLSVSEAKQVLAEVNLTVSSELKEHSEEIEKGEVIRAGNEGERVEKGSEVVLVTSLGDWIEIENYVGQSWTDVEKQLTDSGLVVQQKTANSNEYANGIVMDQSSEAGIKLEEGAAITLTVSVGPKMVTVGNYVGLKENEAKQNAESAGLTVQTTNEYSTKVKKGLVASQSLKKNSETVEGGVITLVVSMGVEQVKVPNLVGKTESAAENALKEAGLKVGDVSREYSSSVDSGKVISQGKDAGKTADKGASIPYTVSKGEEPKTTSSKSSSSKKTKKKKSKKKKKKKSSGADLHW